MTNTYTRKFPYLFLLLSLAWACTGAPAPATSVSTQIPTETTRPPATESPAGPDLASVISIQVSGETGAYQFSVEIQSPDTGCDQYADWWEVISESGDLLYRRILAHSHVTEQPFIRSGGPVAIDSQTTVWVRAHMFPSGYGGVAFKGSVQEGFQPAVMAPGYAAGLDQLTPLPSSCAF